MYLPQKKHDAECGTCATVGIVISRELLCVRIYFLKATLVADVNKYNANHFAE